MPRHAPRVLAAALLALPVACAPRPLHLHAPVIAPAAARDPTPVELDPIASGGAVVGTYRAPGPASVLTAALQAELRGRALRGGEPGGYAVACALDRFAVRSHESVTEARELAVVYADLSCAARRVADGAIVWRGALRGRACAGDTSVLGTDAGVTQRLVDQALSDAAREMASDLALRALGLSAQPSARVFADADQQVLGAGLDDRPPGTRALDEDPAVARAALADVGSGEPLVRAAAWNVVAMAAGPGDPWSAGGSLTLDDDARVRFAQLKALARHGTPGALAELRAAGEHESDPLLAELVADALRGGGIGLGRSRR